MTATGTNWTYVLITPDGLLTDSLSWLLDKLRSVGLEPVAGMLVRLRSEVMLGIYDTPLCTRPVPLPPPRAFDLWYGLGPACLLALHHDAGDACAQMLATKGATDPRDARAGSIRYAGENALTNLVHCPDDVAAAAYELDQLLGEGCAADMRRLAAFPVEHVRTLTVDSLEDCLPARSGPEALSIPLIVNRIRLRILQLMTIRGSADDSIFPDLAKIRSALRDERNEIVHLARSVDRISVARAHNNQVNSVLVEVARNLGLPSTENALIALTTVLMVPENDWPSTRKALHAGGMYISDVEQYALELNTLL